jgi:hypothetical protein
VVVVPEEEGVKLEHTSFIAHVKGTKLIQLSSRFAKTQNCRRQKMLEVVGSKERVQANKCCDSCGVAGLSSRLV